MRIRSKEWTEKQRLAQKGKSRNKGEANPFYGRKHSDESKRKMSWAKQGSKNQNWKGGLTELVKGIRRSPEYYQWRKAIFERDNHICQDCGTTGSVDAHHIESLIHHPELVFDINNGLTLCDNCHKRHSNWQRLNKKGKIKSKVRA